MFGSTKLFTFSKSYGKIKMRIQKAEGGGAGDMVVDCLVGFGRRW